MNDGDFDRCGTRSAAARVRERQAAGHSELLRTHPEWITRVYPIVAVLVLGATLCAVTIPFPDEIRGSAVLLDEGSHDYLAPTDAVALEVRKDSGDQIAVGDTMVTLSLPDTDARYRELEASYEDAVARWLMNSADLATGRLVVERQDAFEAFKRTVSLGVITAFEAGTVDVALVRVGQPVKKGAVLIRTCAVEGRREVRMVFPGSASFGLRETKRVRLSWDTKPSVQTDVVLTYVARGVASGAEAQSFLGGKQLDRTSGQGGVLAIARLDGQARWIEGSDSELTDGTRAESKALVRSRPLLLRLFRQHD